MCFDADLLCAQLRDLPMMIGFCMTDLRHALFRPVCCDCIPLRALCRGCCDLETNCAPCVACASCEISESCFEDIGRSCAPSKWCACLRELLLLLSMIYPAIMALTLIATLVALYQLNAYLSQHSYAELIMNIVESAAKSSNSSSSSLILSG